MKQVLLLLTVVLMALPGFAKPGDALKYMPVQDGGRVKPYDSFAREMLEIIYGKSKFEGRNATEIVMTWMLAPQTWQSKKIFEVRNHQILEALGLPKDQRHFTGDEIFANEKFTLLRQELQAKRETKEKLNPYFQALQRLENQYFIFQEIAAGRMFKVVPAKEGDAWISVADLTPEFQEKFMNVTKTFVTYIGALAQGSDGKALDEAGTAMDEAIVKFEEAARAENPAAYSHDARIKAEVHYNDFHPFRWAYIFYFLAFIVLALIWTLNKESWMKIAWPLLAIGFALNTYGFALRMYIMERAPVSNMYETVIWVAWGTVLFATILELIYKYRIILVAGTLVAAFALVIADFAPAVLDPSLQPLEAVLRSNYWLTIHVMTITISYAAFFLAFGLGDVGLYYYLRGEKKNQEKIRAITTGIYRSMQIGVAFLGPGIILGGIWADYSWGRFWGWDPKETWALIALLGYLAVLHARYAGMIRNFGLVATAVVTFSLVIMAWYGVNFVLGAGLHSYGFGAGGIEYVSAFVAAHMLLVVYVAVVRRGKEA
ncbi:cytochrome c biogenesis protein [Bdellovibrio sp. HCB2-146]|uniref:cytochrome c biogenesis protein n=1 Tax=Bdellovibrio sp. HCB2-146 TaxID=3394362 RepID=UPI0039BC766D